MKIAVLVSGGVDSSVALSLIKEQGHQPTAFYLKIWLEDELAHLGACPWEEDLAYAQAVCERLAVPLEIVPLQKAYWDSVIQYTINEVKAGDTPNPDIFCNARVKFGVFYDTIAPHFEKVATGHYARVEKTDTGLYALKTSPDPVKDQTYFLSRLTQSQLARALFPIGAMRKDEVRNAARARDLSTQSRADSQGICFLGKIRFRDFIRQHLGTRVGEIRAYENNEAIGTHEGTWFYTIGQRQGLGLSGGPWHVVSKDSAGNILYVSRHYQDSRLRRNHFLAQDAHWISGTPPAAVASSEGARFKIKLRHGPNFHTCRVRARADKRQRLEVRLDQRDIGIAPGQFAVFYDDDTCLGAAKIHSEIT